MAGADIAKATGATFKSKGLKAKAPSAEKVSRKAARRGRCSGHYWIALCVLAGEASRALAATFADGGRLVRIELHSARVVFAVYAIVLLVH